MKCLETRKRKGMKWRRYRTADGAIWTTYEVPASVLSHLGNKTLQRALAAAGMRLAALNRVARIKAALVAEIKPAAIAHDEGVSEAYVRHIRLKIKTG